MRELQAGDDVADRVDAGDAGLEPLVRQDEAAVGLHARLLEAEPLGRRAAAHGDEQEVRVVGRAVLEGDLDPLDVLGDRLEAHTERERDAALAERPLELLADRLLLVGHEVGEGLDDLHVHAEGAPDGGELDADDAAAQDRDLLRDVVELERLLARDDAAADLEAGERPGVGAGREDDALPGDGLVADLHGRGGGQAALAFDDGDATGLDEPLEALVLARDDRLAVRVDTRSVDPVERDVDAVLLRLPRDVGDLGRVQERLRGDAAAVQARAAQLALLHEAHGLAQLHRSEGGCIATAPAAEHHHVKVLFRHPGSPSYASRSSHATARPGRRGTPSGGLSEPTTRVKNPRPGPGACGPRRPSGPSP